jgi:hypothetical protein
VAVQFRHAGLVQGGGGGEAAGEDRAADAVAGLEERHVEPAGALAIR